MYFDGRSHGTPGPGGSGVIVRARDEFEIIWMASMSFDIPQLTTMSHYEEILGLCTGQHGAGL
jgi:ribonuclease HI